MSEKLNILKLLLKAANLAKAANNLLNADVVTEKEKAALKVAVNEFNEVFTNKDKTNESI